MKKNQKKLLKILFIFIIIIAVLLIHNFLDNYKPYVLKGYYKMEDHRDPFPFHGYRDYFKYYYTAENDSDFKNSKKYRKVESSDIEKLKNYFEDYGNIITIGGEPLFYDFDLSIIDESDYFLFSTDEKTDSITPKVYDYYLVVLYDTDSHILYEIYDNNH